MLCEQYVDTVLGELSDHLRMILLALFVLFKLCLSSVLSFSLQFGSLDTFSVLDCGFWIFVVVIAKKSDE